MKHTIVCFLSIMVFVLYVVPVYTISESKSRFMSIGLEETMPFDITAKSAVLLEAQTGNMILEKNSHERLPIASITKIMSLILFMESLESGKINPDDFIIVSEHASHMGGSQIWLELGEKMSVRDLLRAVAVNSANDATVALAEKVAGSEEAFVKLMNQKAYELGMKNTNFLDCTGLTDEGHYSSAYDVAIMSRELLIKHPQIIEYTTVWHDYLRDGATELHNTNALVHPKTGYKGCIGLKTGFTNAAGFCLSAAAERGGTKFIAVVLGALNSEKRFSLARKLLDHAFANYELANIEKKGKIISHIPVKRGMKISVPAAYKSDIVYLLKKGEREKIKKEIRLIKSIEAPVAKGKVVGKAVYSIENRSLGEAEIVSTQGVKRATWLRLFLKMFISWFDLKS